MKYNRMGESKGKPGKGVEMHSLKGECGVALDAVWRDQDFRSNVDNKVSVQVLFTPALPLDG